MEKNIIYHGSNVEVSVPRILQNGFYKDFGYDYKHNIRHYKDSSVCR